MSDTTTQAPAAQDENQLMLERREKLKALRQRQQVGGAVAFPNDFNPTHQAEALFAASEARGMAESSLGASIQIRPPGAVTRTSSAKKATG